MAESVFSRTALVGLPEADTDPIEGGQLGIALALGLDSWVTRATTVGVRGAGGKVVTSSCSDQAGNCFIIQFTPHPADQPNY